MPGWQETYTPPSVTAQRRELDRKWGWAGSVGAQAQSLGKRVSETQKMDSNSSKKAYCSQICLPSFRT